MEVKLLSEVDLANTDLVLLDLDNTLYNYHTCHAVAMDALCKQFGDHYQMSYEQVKHLYGVCRQSVHNTNHGTAASHSRLFYVQYMVEAAANTTDTEMILKFYHLYWDTFIAEMKLFDDALPFLVSCRQQNVPVVMVTDMTAEVQFLKLRKLDIIKYLAFIVTSEEAGLEKPHPFVFELAINKVLKSNKNIVNIAVVGDDVKKDIHVSSVYSITNYHLPKHG
ncbi:MAG: superfamily hydrolase [Mucilaginibacter sp.]|nr:superfamily hydrolase [Mucilaginibacter sp.]